MKRVVSFYEKLPRGPAPEIKATGLLGRYQAKHFGKNPTAKRMSNGPTFDYELFVCGDDIYTDGFPLAIIHAIGLLLAIGYPMTYYFHLRKLSVVPYYLWTYKYSTYTDEY